MNQQVSAIRTEQWRRIVCECISRDPKLSKRQWCKENKIRYRSFMYWQRKFQIEELEKMGSSEPSLPAPPVSSGSPAFVDMTAQLETLRAGQVSVSPQQESGTFVPELMIRTGSCQIYVSGSIQEATLEKVMRVLGNA